MNEDEILNSVKDYVGVSSQDTAFDQEILLHINLAFSTLFEIGVGSSTPIKLEEKDTKWLDLFSDYESCLGFIKEYTYMKVRVLFDPPTNSSVFDSMKSLITELEWRIQTYIEDFYTEEEKDTDDGSDDDV